MIKINLLRNKVGDPQGSNARGGLGSTILAGGEAGESSNRGGLFRLLVMCLFTSALVVYEQQHIRNLNQEQARIQAQIVELEAAAKAKADEVASVKDVEKQAKELEDKLKVLKLLSRLRLREVKTLDFMQSTVPEKVWLRNVTFRSDKNKPFEGKFEFKGSAVTTEDLSEFVKRLEDSSYLNEVIVIKNQEVNVPTRAGIMRDFEFTAQVEVKP
jgi:Tfp pilus assembly protein PilN